MAVARSWKQLRPVNGPYRAQREDIPALNQIFSEAFTERYRRDGMVGVRVPFLNPAIWRYALDDAGGGAMVWRGERGELVAFNMAHRSGAEGWMGPLAVRPEWQGAGVGKDVVRAGIDWLQREGAQVIGLETMPRTMDNIGFYSSLGMLPGRLTLTLTYDAASADRAAPLLGRLPLSERDDVVAECRALLERQIPGYDFTRELLLTDDLALGDTLLLRSGGGGDLVGYALCHTVPLVEGRVREELRVLKLVLDREADIAQMVPLLADYARRAGARRVALRAQGDYVAAFERMMALGARVRWTDLRMTLGSAEEPRASTGIVWSNWEV
jgi:GNAT superfamily N-acetyltransferase